MKKKHGGNLREINEIYGLAPGEIIDFSVNVNPLGYPASLKELLWDSFDLVMNYPDPESKILKKKLSSMLSISTDNILPGNGSDELLFLALRALAPKKVLIPVPSYIEYERSSLASGALCSFLNTKEIDNFSIKTEKIIKKIPGAELLFLCNPNNPTGFLMDREKLLYICSELEKQDICLLIDEAFIDFLENPVDCTIIPFLDKFKNVIILRSLTKFFAIPGLRIGYAAANPVIIRKMENLQQTWPLNCFAQIAGRAVLEDEEFILKSRKYLFAEKQRFFSKLLQMQWLKPYKPTANFILCRIKNQGFDAAGLAGFLIKKHNILIRTCSNFRGLEKNYFRLAVKNSSDNDALIYALKDFEKKKAIKTIRKDYSVKDS